MDDDPIDAFKNAKRQHLFEPALCVIGKHCWHKIDRDQYGNVEDCCHCDKKRGSRAWWNQEKD